MRNTLLPTRVAEPQAGDIHAPSSIRLVSATPSASGSSAEANTPGAFSFDLTPSPLKPRPETAASRKRLVPKKSKLSMLGVGNPRDNQKEKTRDFSDVVRRVGGNTNSARGGYEIHVDPAVELDNAEVVLVKKKKSRGTLGALGWGGPMAEITNAPKVSKAEEKEKKQKEEKDKWWTIGRGRKDSKDKTEKEKVVETRSFIPGRSKSKPVPLILQPTFLTILQRLSPFVPHLLRTLAPDSIPLILVHCYLVPSARTISLLLL